MPPQPLSPRVIAKLIEAVEKLERHNDIVDALRFLDCIHGDGSFETCSGIYRLLPPPPPPVRRDLKTVLPKDDYALLSKAWRAK